MLTFARVSIAVTLVVVAGCGAVAPVDTFEIHEASASALKACGPSGAALCERAKACTPFWFDQAFTSVETCSALFTELCVDRYRGVGAAAEIADCSGTVAALSCADLINPILIPYLDSYLDPRTMIDSCPVTPGLFAAGERCLRNGDCTTGHCSAKNLSCGTCIAAAPVAKFLAVGEACTSNDECGSRVCSKDRCVALAKLGESCADRGCDLIDGLTCGSDLLCRPFGTIPTGEVCGDFQLCETGTRCTSDFSEHPARCEPVPTAGVGEDCARGCALELTCVGGRCAAPRPGGPQSCSPAASPP